MDGILERLQTDYIDVLLLHRPDALVEPEEVARAFDDLQAAGKVKHFGVSNHSPKQIQLLNQAVTQELSVNQLQLSIPHAGMIASGLNVNRYSDQLTYFENDLIDYARLNNQTIQAWSPVMGEQGVFLIDETYNELNEVLAAFGEKYGVSKDAMAIAWLLLHPAKIQVILGTMLADRLADYAAATEISLSRQDWYVIYRAAGHELP